MAAGSEMPPGSDKVKSKARQDRLADALRANLRRRKDQKRGQDEAGAEAEAATAKPLAATDTTTE